MSRACPNTMRGMSEGVQLWQRFLFLVDAAMNDGGGERREEGGFNTVISRLASALSPPSGSAHEYRLMAGHNNNNTNIHHVH